MKGRVSVVMPAYNEEGHIMQAVTSARSQFEELGNDWEIIVVDDGSTDATRRIADAFADERIRVVGYPANRGKGHAIKEGFRFVTGEFSFLFDSDMEINAEELGEYVGALENSDIVIGSKRHPDSMVRTPFVRRFLSLGFNLLERLLTGIRASDTQAGLKAARSTALYKVFPLLSVKKYAFDAELLAVASLLNFRIRELPVQIELDALFGARKVFRMLIDLLGIAYRLRVKHWYQKNLAKMSNTYKPLIPW